MSYFSKHRIVGAVAGVALTAALSAQAVAAPFFRGGPAGFAPQAQMQQVRYAPRARGGNGGAAAAAAFGIMALGIGAAIASSQREQAYEPVYVDPGYGYGYAPGYEAPPVVYAPRRNRNDGNFWQQRARAERDRMGY